MKPPSILSAPISETSQALTHSEYPYVGLGPKLQFCSNDIDDVHRINHGRNFNISD